MREQLHGLIVYYHSDTLWARFLVGGATIVSQLDARGRVYLSMVLPCSFNDSRSSEPVQNWSSEKFPNHLSVVKSAHNIHLSDGDLDNLKMVWNMCHSQVQPLSREDGIPPLRTFLNIRTPITDGYFDPQSDKIYFGRIFGQYTDKHCKWGSFSESTAHLIGQIKLQGQPTLKWDSKGWTEVTTGLWRRRSVCSHF